MTDVVLITGASRGIGKEVAKLFLNNNELFKVYVTARKAEDMKDLKDLGAHVIACDLSNETDRNELWQDIVKEDKIDILINNAGYAAYGAVEEVPMDIGKTMYEVNLFACIDLIQKCIPHMRDKKRGHIINISSIAGTIKVGKPFASWYVSSKHALEGFTESLRFELQNSGINITTIRPGIVLTEFSSTGLKNANKYVVDGIYKKEMEKLEKRYDKMKAGRYGASPVSADEVAEIIFNAIKNPNPKMVYEIPYIPSKIAQIMSILLPRKCWYWIIGKMMNVSIKF